MKVEYIIDALEITKQKGVLRTTGYSSLLCQNNGDEYIEC